MSKASTFNSREALDAALSKAICQQLTAGINQNGSATLVVSGGSTPKGLFKALSTTAIDWPKVTVLLADERWVDVTHPDSNSAMVKSLLLTDHAKEANWLDLGAGKDDVEAELARVKDELANLATFDVVVLGMGEDAHTASLFPCSIELAEGLMTDEAALMTRPTTAPHLRLSLTKSRLINTQMGVIHIVGTSKRAAFDSATQHVDDDIHPISHFAHLEQFALWFAP